LRGVPILAVAGDQQAALFGQTCFDAGTVKNTYGTGCFVVLNTGEQAVSSPAGLATTLAADRSGKPCYALEGSIFVGGAVVQWLRDQLRVIKTAPESEEVARSVPDNGGVYLVPAFVGLGAPHWDMEARGTIVGLTRGASREHIVRAALESMAYQTWDVLETMERDTGMRVEKLLVDGGATANDLLMQFQADIIQRPVVRPANVESTSLGVAFLAGLAAGVWKEADELVELKQVGKEFVPSMDGSTRGKLLEGWRRALRQTLTMQQTHGAPR
jgi:glycerol kinase